MKIWLPAFLLSAMLFCISSVQGQDAISERDWITIDWTFDDFGPQGVETPNATLTNLQNSVLKTLSSVGITPYYGVEPDFDIAIGLFGDEQVLVTIDLRVSQEQLTPSQIPLVHPAFDLMHQTGYYEIAFTVRQETHEAIEATKNFIVAMSLYSIHRCDLAENFFDQAQNGASELLYAWEIDSENLQRDQADTIAFYRGNCAHILGNYPEAQDYFEQALFADNGELNFSPAVNLSWTYLQLDQPDEAFSLLDTLLDSQNAENLEITTLQIRSQLYALAFRYDEAIADMDAAIALAPDNARLYVERGQRILLLYEWDRALADYDRALELAPNYPVVYYYRGVLYASVPEGFEARQAALDDFARYLEILPEGEHAEDAARYIAEIQAQLDALSSP